MKHLILGLAGALVAGLAWGQDVPYAIELISQPYAPLEEYSTLDLELGWDDPEVMLPIPFDMVIWGDTCSFLGTANLGEMIIGIGNEAHLIAPVFSDICDVAPADSTGQDVSEIRHTLEGVAPTRIFKVEYHNIGFYDEVYGGDSTITATQRANYQVWLHETGTITFHYGPNTVTDYDLIAADFINSAGLVGNFDLDDYGGTIFVAEGQADYPQFQVFNDFFGWIYGGNDGWGMSWPSDGTGYVFMPVYIPEMVTEPQVLSTVSAFPNPVSSIVNVTLDGPIPQEGMWLDSQGRIVRAVVLQPGANRLDVETLTPGTYTLRIENGATVRVTIQR